MESQGWSQTVVRNRNSIVASVVAIAMVMRAISMRFGETIGSALRSIMDGGSA